MWQGRSRTLWDSLAKRKEAEMDDGGSCAGNSDPYMGEESATSLQEMRLGLENEAEVKWMEFKEIKYQSKTPLMPFL